MCTTDDHVIVPYYIKMSNLVLISGQNCSLDLHFVIFHFVIIVFSLEPFPISLLFSSLPPVNMKHNPYDYKLYNYNPYNCIPYNYISYDHYLQHCKTARGKSINTWTGSRMGVHTSQRHRVSLEDNKASVS